ncbi:MAG TPA: DUF1800 domain-containing protein [Acidimicrobiales bacterium]|nr:DUF1800 domain-containing protein [Acidimicrobiales bacterium]
MAATPDPRRSDLAHLFRRAGFGARPDEVDHAATQGYPATVESLLAGLTGPDPAADAIAPPPFAASGVAPLPPATDPAARQTAIKARNAEAAGEYQALQRWWLNRMIATSTPLREKMTLLWHGHFATAFQKVRVASFMFRQNELFRTLGGGSFETLTQAVAKDPAMMRWLDTESNVAGHPNENFARELMELFTLGIGNYAETDVQAAARAFTGWSLVPATGAFVLRPRRHDSGPKTFLGQSGNFDGTDIVRIVTHQPASARFVVAKLWSHLAYPVAPTDALVAPLAAAYARDLDITSLLRTIFLHPGFTSSAAKQGLVKQPIEWVVGLARAFGLDADLKPSGGTGAGAVAGRSPLSGILAVLAQEPFNPPNVGGWAQNGYWLNTATSLARLQAGLAVAARLDLSWLDVVPVGQRPAAIGQRLSIDGWGQTTLAALNHVAGHPVVLVGLAVTAPEYVLN